MSHINQQHSLTNTSSKSDVLSLVLERIRKISRPLELYSRCRLRRTSKRLDRWPMRLPPYTMSRPWLWINEGTAQIWNECVCCLSLTVTHRQRQQNESSYLSFSFSRFVWCLRLSSLAVIFAKSLCTWRIFLAVKTKNVVFEQMMMAIGK